MVNNTFLILESPLTELALHVSDCFKARAHENLIFSVWICLPNWRIILLTSGLSGSLLGSLQYAGDSVSLYFFISRENFRSGIQCPCWWGRLQSWSKTNSGKTSIRVMAGVANPAPGGLPSCRIQFLAWSNTPASYFQVILNTLIGYSSSGAFD